MLRTGPAYLETVASRRLALTIGNQRRGDLHAPAHVAQAAEIARYYEVQRASCAWTLPDGGQVGWVHHAPRTHDELRHKADALLALARSYEGFLGRAPDYMGVLVAAYGAASAHFGEYAANIAAFAAEAARRDLFITHSTTPLRSRAGAASELQIVRRDADGLRIRGVRAMATSAPLADELFILPQPPGGATVATTLVASIPIETEGLHFVCREPFGGRSRVALAYEETDCLTVFDDVVIPWHRVFVLTEGTHHAWRLKASGAAHLCLQTNARAIAKLESVIGLARYAGQVYGLDANDDFKAVIGKALRDLGLLTSCQHSAVERGALNGVEVYTPSLFPLDAARTFFMESYPRVIGQLRHVLGGELFHLFSADAVDGRAAAILERAWGQASTEVADRQRLTACLHDLLLSDFATRQELYEAHYVGSERRNAIRVCDGHRDQVPAWDAARVADAVGRTS